MAGIAEARWIACAAGAESPVIEKRFILHGCTGGRIEITGLGFFVLYLNGQRVSADRFVPALSDYTTRDLTHLAYPLYDETGHRVYYLEYDLTPFVREGENILQVHLGPGWYRQHLHKGEGDCSFGEQLLARFGAEFVCADGTVEVVSDGSEKWADSFITRSNLYYGERQSAADGLWMPGGVIACGKDIEAVEGPEGPLQKQICTPDRIVRTITPVRLGERGGRVLYDAGENITGWAAVTVCGKKGDTVEVRFGEELAEDGTIDFFSTGGSHRSTDGEQQIQTDRYTSDGTRRTFRPEFSWHGFRYMDVTGEIEGIEVEVVHTDARVISSFRCSDGVINWLYEAYVRTQLDNLHDCVPSDCPHRERLGYTGDGQITARTAMLALDMKDVYPKWIDDILDCQDRLDGHVQHTAPAMGGGGGPGGWGGAIVIVPHEYYKHYGNIAILEKCYEPMKKWLGYMKAHSVHDIVMTEEPGGWCLGDWAALDTIHIPDPFVNTCYMIDCLDRMTEIAKLLGRAEDAKIFSVHAARVRSAVIAQYYEEATGSFCSGTQGADAYALYTGLEKDGRTLRNLCERYDRLGFFDTGFLGTEILIDVLFRNGKGDLAVKLLSGTKKGTYGWMRDHGATTLWEYFQGIHSHNHPMYGAPVRHLFENILGIRQEKGTAGYVKPVLEPQFAALDFAEGSTELPCGKVYVRWEREDGDIRLKTCLPSAMELRCAGGSRVLPAGESECLIPDEK